MAYYLDLTNGSDSNSGLTEALSKKTWSAALGLFDTSSAETLYVKGIGRNDWCTLSSKSNKTITAVPGTRPMLTGRLVSSVWTETATAGVYTNNTAIAASLSISALTFGWGQAVSAVTGGYYGFCVRKTNATGVNDASTATPNEGAYFYNSTTGVITAYFGGANPNTAGKEIAYHTVETVEAAFYLSGCTNCHVNGFDVGPLPKYTDQFGWGFRVVNSQGCSVNGCNFYDLGIHALGSISGTATSNSLICSGCTCIGLAPSGSYLISNCVNAEGNLSGHKYESVHLKVCRWRGLDDLVLSGRSDSVAAMDANSQICFHAHADSSTPIRDVLFDRCSITFLETGPLPWSVDTAPSVAAGDRWNWNAYPFRIDRCTVGGSALADKNLVLATGAYIGIRRTSWTQTASLGNNAAAIVLSFGEGRDFQILWDCCVLSFDLSSGGGLANYMFYGDFPSGTQSLLFLNCSFIDTAAAAPASVRLVCFPNTDDKYWEWVGCALAYRVASTLNAWYWGNADLTNTNHSVYDTLEYGVDETEPRWSQDDYPYWTTARWFAENDTAGIVGRNNSSVPIFVSHSDLTLRPAARAIKRTTRAILPSSTGFNGQAYSGNMGAMQHRAGARVNRRSRIMRTDRLGSS